MTELAPKFTQETYNPATKNPNHFVQAAWEFLVDKGDAAFPKEI